MAKDYSIKLTEKAKECIQKVLNRPKDSRNYLCISELKDEHEVQVALEMLGNERYGGDDAEAHQEAFDFIVLDVLDDIEMFESFNEDDE